jgi:hypothetical protein
MSGVICSANPAGERLQIKRFMSILTANHARTRLMHLLYDDVDRSFSGILYNAANQRNIQVFIPTQDAATEFSSCYDRFKRMSAAPEMLFDEIQSALDEATDGMIYNTLCLLEDTLKQSRYRFGQEVDTLNEDKRQQTDAWLINFAEQLSILQGLSPSELKHHIHCHHVVMDDEPMAIFRFEEIELDVLSAHLELSDVQRVMNQLMLPTTPETVSRSVLH